MNEPQQWIEVFEVLQQFPGALFGIHTPWGSLGGLPWGAPLGGSLEGLPWGAPLGGSLGGLPWGAPLGGSLGGLPWWAPLGGSLGGLSWGAPLGGSMASCHRGFGSPKHCFSATGRAQATETQLKSWVLSSLRRYGLFTKRSGAEWRWLAKRLQNVSQNVPICIHMYIYIYVYMYIFILISYCRWGVQRRCSQLNDSWTQTIHMACGVWVQLSSLWRPRNHRKSSGCFLAWLGCFLRSWQTSLLLCLCIDSASIVSFASLWHLLLSTDSTLSCLPARIASIAASTPAAALKTSKSCGHDIPNDVTSHVSQAYPPYLPVEGCSQGILRRNPPETCSSRIFTDPFLGSYIHIWNRHIHICISVMYIYTYTTCAYKC